MKYLLAGIASASLAVMGCVTTSQRVAEMERARSAVQALERQPLAQTTAAAELANARHAMAAAEKMLHARRPANQVVHEAYSAERYAQIGLALIAEADAVERMESARAERQEVLLRARTFEAERAEALAELRETQLMQSAQEAELAKLAAEAAIDEAFRLAEELSQMEATQTERGVVLTLSDVLFDTNRTELKSGAKLAMDRLAAFLVNNPERRLLIEGHTDSRGSLDYNEELSAQRADSVMDALVERGIDKGRLRTRGLGELYPVATNDTPDGMQQNRRVEIVISNNDGEFPGPDRQANARH